MGKKSEQSRKAYNKMAWGYDSAPEGNYTRPHKAELMKRIALRDGDSILDVACGDGYLLGELSKKASVNANTVVFPFSKTGDVKVYNQKELRSFFELAGFTDLESYTVGAVLFFSAKKNSASGILPDAPVTQYTGL